MARPRTPTARLELSGAFKHNPNRERPEEPRPKTKIGQFPERLPVECRKFWDEIVSQAGGWLTDSDRWAVELAARLMQKATRELSVAMILELAGEAELEAGEIKELVKRESISAAELGALTKLLGALGMTPSDRSKISVPQEKPKNRFADLAAEASAPRPN